MDDKITSMDDRCCDKKFNEAKKTILERKHQILFLENLYRYKFEVTFL
jgi:hypothetical protein